MFEFLPPNLHQLDLHLIQFGMEQCEPNHTVGPGVRDYYKIHCILEGEGDFEIAGNAYRLGPGDGFLITPGEVARYAADGTRPWRYCWIGFDGIKAATLLGQAGLSHESPVFSAADAAYYEGMIERMERTGSMKAGRVIRLTGLLYEWLSAIVEAQAGEPAFSEPRSRDRYVAQVVHLIETNYASRLAVADIARFVGLQRSYLNALFQEVMGCSIQQHLIAYRMRRAGDLLVTTQLSVGDIARSVGYDDPLLFSKMFRKTMGASPTDYRARSSHGG
ncbi:AraC family ligand binding domain-containing protein [Paenibacillus soyae]|uniref:AraC family ligand binding domain-containing protein n=1 Tax=Paenibacillus soyae TaxID=2969249 RepID=A0A9X2SDW6_9BACL|nr:AraC family ligand binding domain-containing protein [Paenibacillus soyae]MCR2807532.1 AraC family ligand binding domain-containing protein [Paenibacillus soyae]